MSKFFDSLKSLDFFSFCVSFHFDTFLHFSSDIVIFVPKRLQNKFEEPQVKYDGNYETDKIKKFLQTETLGLCGHRTSDNAGNFPKPLVVVYYNVDYQKDPKGKDMLQLIKLNS